MAENRFTYPKFKAFTASGALAAGYKVYTYEAGTTTPVTTYSDAALSSANTNPIILNDAGEGDIHAGVAVKLVLKDADDATIWTVDDVDPTSHAASDVSFDPTDTSFTGTTVQTAIEDASDAIAAVSNAKRNRVINSEMMVDQRNGGVAIAAAGYPVDRMQIVVSAGGDALDELVFSAQRQTGLGDSRNSVKITASTKETEIVGGEYFIPLLYRFLGYDVADLASDSVTISFYFKSNVTGSHSIVLRAGDASRSYVTNFTYSTSGANQLITKTITLESGTTTLTNLTTGVGMELIIAGCSTGQATTDAWVAGSSISSTTSENWITSGDGAYVQIGGLQVREGDTHFALDKKTYEEYLYECYPYYWSIGGGGESAAGVCEDATHARSVGFVFPAKMVGTPSVTTPTVGNYFVYHQTTSTAVSAWNSTGANAYMCTVDCQVAAGLTAGESCILYGSNSDDFIFDAEI